MINQKDVLIICGPTATGKSDFALDLSEKICCEIISADSVQVYKDMNIGSAKVTDIDKSKCKHHLIDILNPDQSYSVALFKQNCEILIEQIQNQNKLPVIVGGTALYIKSLLFPLSFGANERNPEFCDKLLEEANKFGNDYLFEKLKSLDYESSQTIEKNNVRRVIRAIELATFGTKKSELTETTVSPYNYKLIALYDDREKMYSKINKRVEIMMQNGLEKEVRNLVDNYKLTRNSQSMQAIGYKEFFDYFDGKISLEDVVYNIQINTRHFAKRQMTYLKKLPNIEWVKTTEKESVINQLVDYFSKYKK